jgi:hypothetical protein
MTLMNRRLLHYDILGEIGRGGMNTGFSILGAAWCVRPIPAKIRA